MAAVAAMAAMAVMAAMTVMATLMSSTGIRDYRNRTIHRQDTFGTSTESSLAGV
jgi:Na+/proline symporter